MLDVIGSILDSKPTWFVLGAWFGVFVMAFMVAARDE